MLWCVSWQGTCKLHGSVVQVGSGHEWNWRHFLTSCETPSSLAVLGALYLMHPFVRSALNSDDVRLITLSGLLVLVVICCVVLFIP